MRRINPNTVSFVIEDLVGGAAYYPNVQWGVDARLHVMWDESDCVWVWADESDMMAWSRSASGYWGVDEGRIASEKVRRRRTEGQADDVRP